MDLLHTADFLQLFIVRLYDDDLLMH